MGIQYPYNPQIYIIFLELQTFFANFVQVLFNFFMNFRLQSPYAPAGDQPEAVESLAKALSEVFP